MVNAVHVGLIERSEGFPVARLGRPDDSFLVIIRVIFRFQILLHPVPLRCSLSLTTSHHNKKLGESSTAGIPFPDLYAGKVPVPKTTITYKKPYHWAKLR